MIQRPAETTYFLLSLKNATKMFIIKKTKSNSSGIILAILIIIKNVLILQFTR